MWLIVLYCVFFAVIRMFLSESMSPDEAEQFWLADKIAWGYETQAPLYNWIVAIVTKIFGLSVQAIIVVKHIILFGFYASFYYLCKHFWDDKKALLITGSLMLFPTFAYDFALRLTHVILATTMASVSLLAFVKLLKEQTRRNYLFLGLALGLGCISKYSFAIFLIALALTTASTKIGREALFRKRSLITISSASLVVLPHFIWLIANDFPPFKYTLGTSHAGEASYSSVFVELFKGYFLELLLFLGVFIVIFYSAFDLNLDKKHGSQMAQIRETLKYLALYSVLVPVALILSLKTGRVLSRWFTVVHMAIVPGMFLFVNFDKIKYRMKVFASIVSIVVLVVATGKTIMAFSPDWIGKVKKENTPYMSMAKVMDEEIQRRGIAKGTEEVIIIADQRRLAANLKNAIPNGQIYLFPEIKEPASLISENKPILLTWAPRKYGVELPKIPIEFKKAFPKLRKFKALETPYINAKKLKPYKQGLALVL